MFFPKAETFLGLIKFGKSSSSRYELADMRLLPSQVSCQHSNVTMKSCLHLCPVPFFTACFLIST